jgi:serine/threonine-protein kinase
MLVMQRFFEESIRAAAAARRSPDVQGGPRRRHMSDVPEVLRAELAGRYRVERELGAGGMATVYLAHDLKHDRQVAIKLLHAELATALGAERFLTEIRTTARLQHPHILPLLDSGDANGQPYFVMPYVQGESLRDRLSREKRLPVDEAVHITREIGDALEYAHQAGIMHRDVKPENILLSGGHALLADFGVARPMRTDNRSHRTGTGIVVGTAGYMSPEQAAGERDLGPPTDQYALGCVAYEMLAGEPPFAGPTVQSIIAKRLTTDPTRLRVLRAAIPASVEAAVQKALARDPVDRYPAVAGFVRALATSGAVPAPAARPELSVAVLPFVNLSAERENEYFSDGVTEDIITQLSKISSLKVISRTSVMRFKGTSEGLRQIGDTLGVGTVVEGSVRRAGDRLRITAQLIDVRTDAHLWAETYDRRLTDVFEIQSDVAQRISDALRARLTPEERSRVQQVVTADIEAYNLTLLGRHYWHWWTEEGFRKSIECFDQAIARDPSYAPAHAGRGLAYASLSLGYWSVTGGTFRLQAEQALGRALEIDPTLGEAMAWRAQLHMQYDYAWERAEAMLQRAVEVDPNSASVHDVYGNFLAANGRHRESARQFEMAVALDPLSYLILANAALCAHRAREFAKAREFFEREIALSPELPMGYGLLGMTAMQLGQVDDALAAERKAAAIYGLLGYPFLAVACAASGQRDEAFALLAQCEEARTTQNVWLVGLAMAYAQLGETNLALTRLEEACEARDFWMVWLKVQPELDPLRGEPRFQRLLRTVHLE